MTTEPRRGGSGVILAVGPVWRRRIAQTIAVGGVLCFVLAVRVVSASHGELREADRLRARGDVASSVAHYRRAARWYAPGNPYSTEALERLADIGEHAEQAGDPDLALAAYRSIRGAILGARSVYVPHRERLASADEHIASLMAALPPSGIDAARSTDERRADHLALLRATQRPSVPWAIAALLGLAAWIAAAYLFVTRAIDEDDHIVGREARIWGTVWICGFGLFVLGLALA